MPSHQFSRQFVVAIDLAALYGRQPHWRRPNELILASMDVITVGHLSAWIQAETGWYGACRYRIKLGHAQYLDQDHAVPAWALKRASDDDIRQAPMRGEFR